MGMGALRMTAATPEDIARVLQAEKDAPFGYAPVGAWTVPDGWFENRGDVEVGRGQAVFERARAELRSWRMFDLGWARSTPRVRDSIAPGDVVAVTCNVWGIRTLNVAKIVAVWDEPRRFAFSYGTTAHHVESGEETFSVTWHADDRVTYEVWSYSKPRHPLVRLFGPIARGLQRKFIRDSCARMKQAAAS